MIKTKVIGRLPQNYGDFDPHKQGGYGKKQRCFLFACEWESKMEGNTYAPATLDTTTGVITPDTAHWKHCSGSYNDWLIDNGYKKVDAGNVKDGNSTQHEINTALAQGIADETLRAQNAENDRYTKSEVYTKAEVNGLITTPDQEFVTVTADNTWSAVDLNTLIDTAAGSDKQKSDTVYRVGNWDGSQFDDTVYSEYAWNGTDYVHLSTKTQIGEVFDISAYHATGGTLQTYTDLADALTGTNGGVPSTLQKGGMSIKFVSSVDNKYVQYRLMSDTFNTTPANWQGVDDELTAGSNNLVKSGVVVNEIYSLIFNDIKDIKITKIQELYLTGLSEESTYYCRINSYNGAKDIFIYGSDKTTAVALGTFTGNLVTINQRNDSGISGYAVVRNTDAVNILPGKESQINVKNVSNVENSPSIKHYIDSQVFVNYPIFGATSKTLHDSGLAGKFFGFPFLVPDYSQRENIIMTTVGELYLHGIDKHSNYYINYNLYNGSKYVHIYDHSKTTILARGLVNNISNGIVPLVERNSSGIYGFLKYTGNPDNFVSSGTYIKIANEYCTDITYSPNIKRDVSFFDISTLTENSPLIGYVRELYIEGMEASEYSLRILYNSGTGQQIFQIYSGDTLVLQGYRTNGYKKTIELFEIGGSHLYGVIMFDGELTFSHAYTYTINKSYVGNLDNSPNIRLLLKDAPITVGKIDGSFRCTSLLRGIYKAEEELDKTVIVASGTYDLEEEFKEYYGNDYFDNFVHTSDGDGILLKNRVHIIFSSGAKVVFNYSGPNTAVKQYFSPFNTPLANIPSYGFTLENLVLEASNCRYCVHDDRGTMIEPYTNKYINCSMKIDNRNNPVGYPVCIGGGLGLNGYVEIKGCKFESLSYGVRSNGIVGYHNCVSANAQSRLVAQGNCCMGLGTFKFSWYGTSTLITEILVSGNSVGSPIDVMAETEQSTVENINVIQWNNEVRS